MKEFLASIDSFLSGALSYSEFERKVSNFYVVDEKSDALPKEEAEFLNDVYERTTYTSEGLSKNDADRRYGVIDEGDFKKWLQEMKEKNSNFWQRYR